ncbi:MAG: PH domain-containing protein [Candidatus Thermoplasmatota archaeon]|mgnify:CR=1 FL=1
MEGLDRFGRFVNRRELDALAGKLEDGERVLAAIEATRDRRGVLAATDRRLLFVRRGWLGARSQAWPYRQVLGLTRKSRVDDATLILRTPDGTVDFTAVPKAEAEAFEDAVATRPRAPGELLDFAVPAAQADRRRRLERLDRMLARGSITRSEYERSKRAIALEQDA